MKKEILIVKASGVKEPFSEEKLRRSLRKSGTSPALAEEVVGRVKKELKDGMRTRDIYKYAFSLLRGSRRFFAARYSLKKAIMELGPTGHPFEKFVGELLKEQGFSVEVGKVVRGSCVSHEIDVIGKKDNRHIMVECKFHNQQGIKSDVKTALYVQARFEDIKKQWQHDPDHGRKWDEAWLVTNTKLTTDAIQYARCVGMKAIGWNYPADSSLQRLVEKSGLHPVTCTTSLNREQKQGLLEQGIVLCRDIAKNRNFLKSLGVNEAKMAPVLGEVNELCGNAQ